MFKFCKEGRLHSISTSKCFTTSRNIRRPFVLPIKHWSIIYMYHVLTSFWTQYVLAMLVKRARDRNSPKTITKENLQKISSDLEVGGTRQPFWWKVIRSGAAVYCSIHHVYIFIFMFILALFDLFVGLLRRNPRSHLHNN